MMEKIDLPSLEEVCAMKRFWEKHLDDPELDKDVTIVCVSLCDGLIEKIKQTQLPIRKDGE